MEKRNKVISISVVILLFVGLSFLIYNFIDFYKIVKIKKNKIVFESVTDEKYVLTSFINDPIKGVKNTPISIYLFSDYETSKTKDVLLIIDEILKKYPDKVNLVWKDLPIVTNRFSKSAALACRCAKDQEKYWEYNRELFDAEEFFSVDLYQEIADKLKLDKNKFLSCYNSQKYLDAINYNVQEAYVLNIKDVPTIFINQQKFEEDITQENLDNIIKVIIK